MEYVHLDLLSSYSLLESTIKIDKLIELAKTNNCKVLAIADKNVMYGAIEFYKKAIKNNIKPLIGLNIDFKELKLISYAKNEKGYLNLMKISSLIQEGSATIDQIKKLLSDVITIADSSDADYKYLDVIQAPVRYLNQEGFRAYHVIKAIKEAKKINVNELSNDNYFFKSEKTFSENQKNNLKKIINDIDLKLEFGKAVLPKFEIPDGGSSRDYLKHLCLLGLKHRLNNDVTKDYLDRLENELAVIDSMGYNDYFLITWDFVRFAIDNNIAVGPGRGSASGSLVAYCLTITNVDPIKYNLFFERFLNKDRISMPDIDIDFMDTRREEVINYIAKKYGRSRVALIITFQTIAAKSSIRDVARVVGVDLKDADRISKSIPNTPGTLLIDAFKVNKFKTIINSKQEFIDLYNMAKEIEGIPRNFSTHAAGLVLTDKDLNNYVPTQKGSTGLHLSQYSMNHLEDLGLLKIDILGLRNLTVITEILNLINKRHNKFVKLSSINLNDKETLDLLQKGLTTGIFQLESTGMKNTLKRMRANSLEDIISTSSLYRPGPQDNIPTYINRKLGRESVDYIDESVKDILEPTYGIIVYQEQIMQIATKYAGLTLSKADILRRAMGKKIASELLSMKNEFINGAIKNKHSKEQAIKVYDLIFKFADYGFNRSHAVAYSLIGYQMLYLKAHYSLEFMSCLLSSVTGSADKISNYISECKSFNIKVLAPSINASTEYFRITKDDIIYPLTALKQLGGAAYKEIHRLRLEDGKFSSIYNFFGRIQLARVPSSSVTTLIKSGALDEFGHSRKGLLNSIDNLVKWAKACIISKDGDYIFDESLLPKVSIDETIDNENDIKKYEMESIGFYLSVKETNLNFEGTKISEMNELQNKSIVHISGTLKYLRPFTTKWGQTMAFSSLKDSTGVIDIMISPSVWSIYKDEIKAGMNVKVTAELVNASKLQLKASSFDILDI